MNFDFQKHYETYSNIELLKIVWLPDDYQPTAVAAATQILSNREVTAEETQLLQNYFEEKEQSEKNKKDKLDAIKNRTTDFFEPVLYPGEKVEPNKWVNLLLLFIAIQYAWSFYNTAKRLINFLACYYCSFDITIVIELLSLLYIPFIFFLLFKRRRWGWILLFADVLFSLITLISQSYIFFKYQNIHQGAPSSFLVSIFLKSAFFFFLWRESIANHFGITQDTKKKTLKITVAGTLLFILFMSLIF